MQQTMCITKVTSSPWAKTRVLAFTDRIVATPLSTLNSVVFDASVEYTSVEDSHTSARDGDVERTFDRIVPAVAVPALTPLKSVHEGAFATVIQIWEGIVLSVDHEHMTMAVKLKDRGGLIAEHSADIDLQWVAHQDYDLLASGAVFYWTVYKETKKGSISNNQEIRFRRLPSWTKSQLALVQQDAQQLATKFSTVSRVAD